MTGLLESLDKSGVIFRSVDSDAAFSDDSQSDPVAIFENPELFELFGYLQIGRRHGGDLLEKFWPEGIDAQVQKGPWLTFEGLSIAVKGDGRAGEIEGIAAVVFEHFDARRVAVDGFVEDRGPNGSHGGFRPIGHDINQ